MQVRLNSTEQIRLTTKIHTDKLSWQPYTGAPFSLEQTTTTATDPTTHNVYPRVMAKTEACPTLTQLLHFPMPITVLRLKHQSRIADSNCAGSAMMSKLDHHCCKSSAQKRNRPLR
ncbi:unnamed protein product [Cercospora beticola]|nr:unnamed protein product [Cercospora beticola]